MIELECDRCINIFNIDLQDLQDFHFETNGQDLCGECYEIIIENGNDPEFHDGVILN